MHVAYEDNFRFDFEIKSNFHVHGLWGQVKVQLTHSKYWKTYFFNWTHQTAPSHTDPHCATPTQNEPHQPKPTQPNPHRATLSHTRGENPKTRGMQKSYKNLKHFFFKGCFQLFKII